MLRTASVVAAADSRKPNGIHQKTRRAKKLIPKEATARPRVTAGTSWTSIMADSGPFIPVISGPHVGRTVGEQTASRRRRGRSGRVSPVQRSVGVVVLWNSGPGRPVGGREKNSKSRLLREGAWGVPQTWETPAQRVFRTEKNARLLCPGIAEVAGVAEVARLRGSARTRSLATSATPGCPSAEVWRLRLQSNARSDWSRSPSGPASCPLPEPLEAVCQLRSPFPFVRELGHEQRERLRKPGDPEWAGVHRLESHVADQAGGDRFCVRFVAAVDQAGSFRLAPATIEHAEKH